MKKTRIFSLVLLCGCSILLLSACDDSGIGADDPQITPVYIGTWKFILSPDKGTGALLSPYMDFSTMDFTLSVTRSNSLFAMNAVDSTTKDTLSFYRGDWSIAGDSLALMPDTCGVIDTAADTLIGSCDCASLRLPVKGSAIDTSKTPATWAVPVHTLEPTMAAFGISIPQEISSMPIVLTKELTE